MMNNIPRSEFPRPDFERKDWMTLSGIHDYSFVPNTLNKYADIKDKLNSTIESRILFVENNNYCEQPIMMTEYGGIAFVDEKDDGWGYLGKIL